MPFRLRGEVATFQQLMNQVLSLHNSYATVYIDNIIVYSPSWEDHIWHLTKVLQALGDAGITANPAKCNLGQREVTYLGYMVGRGKLHPMIDKIQALRDYPTPKTKKQVWQFLGLEGYYWQFVPNFSTLATLLTDLMKKTQPQKIQWMEKREDAFHTLRPADPGTCVSPTRL